MSSPVEPPRELDSPAAGDLSAVNTALRERLALYERLGDALDELRELGPISEIIERAPAAAARVAALERVVLSRVDDGMLVAESMFLADGAGPSLIEQLKAQPVRIEYPLAEGEALRRRRAQIVRASETELLRNTANAAIMGWRELVLCPVILDGRVIAFFHGDREPREPIGEGEVKLLSAFTRGFAAIYERAILRHRLRVQRRELRQIASWADAKTSELSDRAIDLTTDREQDTAGEPSATPDPGLRDLLTRREVDVLELMVTGETNAGIARALVVSEGTIKFHVKNILRKLHASNRAEATSRYLRLTLGRDGGRSRLP